MTFHARRHGPHHAPLGEVAELRVGYNPSSRDIRERKRLELRADADAWERDWVSVDVEASLRGLLPRALLPDGTIAWDDLEPVAPMRGAERYRIRPGDLLLPLRAQRLQVVLVDDCPAEAVLAVGQWAMITPFHGMLDADYLTWFLNHPTTLAMLEGRMQGSALRFLTVGAVRDLEVPVPDRHTQSRIGRVMRLTRQVSRLERELADARLRLADAACFTALHHAAPRR